MTRTRWIDGLNVLSTRYRGLIVDLWGTVHDGEHPLPGTIDALERARRAGMRIVFLTNSPRRQTTVATMLRRMAIGDDLYDGLVTSGELAVEAVIAAREDHPALRILHLGPPALTALFDCVPDLSWASTDTADLAVATGWDPLWTDSEVMSVLRVLKSRQTPVICTNPDLFVYIGAKVVPCAGRLAALYRDIGGRVIQIGKPHAAVYERAGDMLRLSPDEVLAIGDALATDIAGARAAGIDSLLVLTGIEGRACLSAVGGLPKEGDDEIRALLAGAKTRPDFVTSSLRW